jgi:hypothetical protein
MTTLQGQFEKMFSDVVHGPQLSDMIEVAALGAAVGAALGYLKDRRSTKSFAAWGAGLGVAGQYMLFQMLKPTVRVGARYYTGGQSGPAIVGVQSGPAIVGIQSGPAIVGQGSSGSGWLPATGCPAGSTWSDWYKACVQNIPPPPPPPDLPASLSEWEALHAGDHHVGAVKGIGGFRGGSMPYGPGPWPTQGAPDPSEVGWG